MSQAYHREQSWIEHLQDVDFLNHDMTEQQGSLDSWLSALESALTAHTVLSCGLTPCHPLAQVLQSLKQHLAVYPQQWHLARQALKPALDLAYHFDNSIVLLVFGKFNAGKSSFCNLIAERFLFHKQSVRYFVWDNGEIQYHSGPFQEGSTETTAQIQGVILADRLVLVDTPGLHSMTGENAQLTQQFLESADGMLWLSSSTSPGQVQELEELTQELKRNKTLLPVITRSDYLDEVVVGQTIQKELKNKSDENRELQEKDVWERAQNKLQTIQLDPQLVAAPISISVYSVRQQENTDQALEEAGIYRLYDALLGIIKPVITYKKNKPVEVFFHYLEETVLEDVKALVQRVEEILAQLSIYRQEAEGTAYQIAQRVWQRTMSTVPTLLDKHLSREQGASLLKQALTQMVLDSWVTALETDFSHYKLDSKELFSEDPVMISTSVVPWGIENYETIYLSIETQLEQRLNDLAKSVIEPIQDDLLLISQSLENLIILLQEKTSQLGALKAT